MKKLTDDQKFVVWNALFVAKQRFAEDQAGASKLAEEARKRGDKNVAQGWERIATQFVKQVDECDELIPLFG